jgi:type VI secretion system protein ImpJ
MRLPSKVLWTEGLPLAPQQFQQTDRYHEARLQRIASAINPHLWGVRALSVNVDQLSNNVLSINTMSLIFQDGDIVEAPSTDQLPSEVDLSQLPASEQTFTFFAALPILKTAGGNVADATARPNGARYTQVASDTADLFADSVNVEVAYLNKQVRLLSQLEPREDHVSFPVLRLRRAAHEGFEIDPTFMPPGLTIDAVDGLQPMLAGLLGKLHAKIAALNQRQRRPSHDIIEVANGDMASFWMLHTISTAAASLSHCVRYRQYHPVVLFDKLCELAGGLIPFTLQYSLAELPAYQHEDPAPGFTELDALIRDLVDTLISTRYLIIPLENSNDGSPYYRGKLDSPKIDRQTTLCLGVNASMPALELVERIPRLVKLGSPEDVERMVCYALSGVTLAHMPQVPSAVPIRPNTYYFVIDRNHAKYENMLKAQAITIYIPDVVDDVEFELIAIVA